jgi:hypothetical protein
MDYGGAGGPMPQDRFQAIVLINPAKEEAAITRDLMVEPTVCVTGTVVAPDDKPLTGVRVQGLPEPILKTDQFVLRGNSPGRPRRLYFYHDTQRLAATLLVKGNEKEKLTVRLEPWGTVTGRLVGRDGEPLAFRGLFSASRDPRVVTLPGHFQTNKDGSFRLEGLIPGAKYTFYYTKPAPLLGAAEGYLFQGLTVKSGETRDLGTTPAKSFTKN